jgi:hypothetical protein
MAFLTASGSVMLLPSPFSAYEITQHHKTNPFPDLHVHFKSPKTGFCGLPPWSDRPMRAERFTRVFSSTRISSENENMMRESVFLRVFVLSLFSEISCGQFVKQHNQGTI